MLSLILDLSWNYIHCFEQQFLHTQQGMMIFLRLPYGKKFSRELIFANFFFGHFAGINFCEFGFTEYFAGINFRELCFNKDFAGINFRELCLTKDFAGINFRESTLIKILRE